MNSSTVSQYLKQCKRFRALLALPLAARRWFLFNGQAKAAQNYRQTVVGGRLVISPSNIAGRFRISAVSDLAREVITTGSFEPDLTDRLGLLTLLDGDIITVGANVGFYPVFFARQCPRARNIYAIEPNPEAYSDLQWNIEENGCANRIEAVPMCVGEIAGKADLAVVTGMPEYSSIDRIVHASATSFKHEHIVVNIAPLKEAISNDDLDPVLILVDAEGAELLIFRGAEGMLKEREPLLVFECDDHLLQKSGHSSRMLEEYLASIGYEVRNALAPRLALKHPFVGQAIAFPSRGPERIRLLRETLTSD